MSQNIERLLEQFGLRCWYDIPALFADKYRGAWKANEELVVGEIMDAILVESDIENPKCFLVGMGIDTAHLEKVEDFFDNVNLDFHFNIEGLESERIQIELYGVRYKEEAENYLKEVSELIEQGNIEQAIELSMDPVEDEEEKGELEEVEDYLFNLPKIINGNKEFKLFLEELRREIFLQAGRVYG